MEFTFEIKTKDGEVLVQEIVAFGDDKNPFPSDWKNNGMALKALWEYQEEFVNKHLDVVFEQRTSDLE